ncbi:putative ankyrin repeat protein [Phaeomoniella chlamydospora]|uniref:Putative ankyrin repeat protein n=1 Tax=Phaeomoniella chlamydospora TaxID=158046 RepID=A0A0G2F044_PHACM|nr:putative ankyrin repeat protein [Phaeomoniella chlamydospora]
MHGLSILHVLNVNSFQKVDQLIEFLTWAVRKGVNVRQRSRDGQTALHLMMQHLGEKRWADRIFDFFSQTELDIEARDRWGLKARDIFRGEKRGHQKRISAQALNDLDLKQKDQDMLQIVNNLAQDPLLEDSWGRNALGCLAYITRPMPDVPLLHQPAYARLNLLFFCLGFDMDVNHYDMSGSTALHSFVFKPRLEEYKDELTTAHFVRALINAGADVRLRDRNGDTALHLACKYGRINCVHALLHARSDLNAVNDGGRTVLAEARWWLEHGEDTDAAARVQMCMAEIHARGGKDVLENQNQCY